MFEYFDAGDFALEVRGIRLVLAPSDAQRLVVGQVPDGRKVMRPAAVTFNAGVNW